LHLDVKWKIVLLIGLVSVFALANVPKTEASADDNVNTITVPEGEEKNLWELVTDPFTRYLHGAFHLVWIMTIAGMIWFNSENLGMALLWVITASIGLAGLPLPGTGTVFFVIVAVFAVAVAVARIIIKKARR